MIRKVPACLPACLLVCLCALPASGQSAGKTGAQILQFNPGARAAAIAGAYSASGADADVLFYNPAGAAALRRAASTAFENYTLDISFGSAAGLVRVNALRIGASISYLDAGSINEVVPDPELGGNVGTETGNRANASESAARLSVATRLRGARVGGSIGYVSSNVAEASSNAAFLDAGIQYDLGKNTFAFLLRSMGGSDLPAEARIGASRTLARGNLGALIGVDAIMRLRESGIAVVAGMEAGLLPSTSSEFGAVVRVGFDGESSQLAPLRFGAGLMLHRVAVDYAFQNMDIAGVVHRVGVRWSVR